MFLRGIRGATTVKNNVEGEILTATSELLSEIILQNEIDPEEIGSVFITVTNDLDATFPARSIRGMRGWELVPLMCASEIPVKGSLPKCVRLMVMVNTSKKQSEIVHVYLNDAIVLRPDLSEVNA